MGWKDLNIKGISKIEKVVAEFYIWSFEKIPYGKFKVKIIENKRGSFIGIPNIAMKNQIDGAPEWISGRGSTVDEALEDTLKCFMEIIAERKNLDKEDFQWSYSEDF